MALTNKTAVEALETLLAQHSKNEIMSQIKVNRVSLAVKESLTFRDYVMGALPLQGTESAIKFLSDILPLVDEGDRAPFYTILSGYYYEIGDKELAFVSLTQAQILDPDYSLAKLLDRAFKAGWESNAFPEMRAQLHPKVSAELLSEPELVIA